MMALSEKIQVLTDPDETRAFSRRCRAAGKRIALVPTMGNLHAGHLDLVKSARQLADVVIVSIYVNPTQFSKSEDFGVYPRTRERDRALLQELQVEATFEPLTLYHPGRGSSTEGQHLAGTDDSPAADSHETYIQVERLQQGLCGRSRPHFFRGVATVVAKLFNILEPDVAVFGRKDYQQWRLICRMVRDLDFGIEIVGMPITREADGLAMSSRNSMLTPDERIQATCIRSSLEAASENLQSGKLSLLQHVVSAISQRICDGGGRMDYVEVVDAQELTPVDKIQDRPVVIAVAAWFGSVRLIDNIEVQVKR
ncbi:hypothetical protein WJX74_010762 [Apatococcus lobatus]|uniref:Pantoate--beta-alanine ligase n=1 Tax=Apatococcus lobatus TaxID=904363 RepID=A0AAW1RED7_9CHLO